MWYGRNKRTDCIIEVPITSGNIKWHSFALRFRASNHKSTWQPQLPFAKGLSFTFVLHYARVMVIFTFPFYILSFGKHIVLERSWYIYCWHYPWGKRLGGNTISPYLSMSVSNCERLNDSWVCGVCWIKALTKILLENKMNQSSYNDSWVCGVC